eukprot:scaffold7685_cov103-Isochrysis_galbana.AAC.1
MSSKRISPRTPRSLWSAPISILPHRRARVRGFTSIGGRGYQAHGSAPTLPASAEARWWSPRWLAARGELASGGRGSGAVDGFVAAGGQSALARAVSHLRAFAVGRRDRGAARE